MKDINNYISEKLHIGKEYSVEYLDEDNKYFNIVSKLFLNNGMRSFDNERGYFSKFFPKSKNDTDAIENAMMLYSFVMVYTKSIPKITPDGKNVYSTPGNFGMPLMKSLIKVGVKPEDIIKKYEDVLGQARDKEPEHFQEHLKSSITYITDRLSNYKFDVELTWDNPKTYSESGIKMLIEDTDSPTFGYWHEIKPFRIKNSKVDIQCELCMRGEYKIVTYYINGKSYHLSDDVIEKLSKMLK